MKHMKFPVILGFKPALLINTDDTLFIFAFYHLLF